MTERPHTVAGHVFDHNGCCTIPAPAGGVCPVRWSWIRGCVDPECVGMKGIAHVDTPPLNISEIGQIRRMNEWESEQCHVATHGAGSCAPPPASNSIEVVESDG